MSITESFGALLKVRLLPSRPKVSIRGISGLAFMTLSLAAVTKQRECLADGISRDFIGYVTFPINYESGKSLVQR